jgi:hypothetical protein
MAYWKPNLNLCDIASNERSLPQPLKCHFKKNLDSCLMRSTSSNQVSTLSSSWMDWMSCHLSKFLKPACCQQLPVELAKLQGDTLQPHSVPLLTRQPSQYILPRVPTKWNWQLDGRVLPHAIPQGACFPARSRPSWELSLYAILFYFILSYFILLFYLFYFILFYLFYFILFYVIYLFYFILFYFIFILCYLFILFYFYFIFFYCDFSFYVLLLNRHTFVLRRFENAECPMMHGERQGYIVATGIHTEMVVEMLEQWLLG